MHDWSARSSRDNVSRIEMSCQRAFRQRKWIVYRMTTIDLIVSSIALVAKTLLSHTFSSIETQQTREILTLWDRVNLFHSATRARLLASIEVASSRERLLILKAVVTTHQRERAFRQRLRLWLTAKVEDVNELKKKKKRRKKNKQQMLWVSSI